VLLRTASVSGNTEVRCVLVRRDADPLTLGIAIISIYDGLRILALAGVERDELRTRWIDIRKILLKTEEGFKPRTSSICTDDGVCMVEMRRMMCCCPRESESFAIPDRPNDCKVKECKVRHGKK
jgi:hypothetical protein